MNKYINLVLRSLIISFVGVYVIDYFSHLLFSDPMETGPYFLTKASLYFVFSLLFLSYIHLEKKEFWKVLFGGIIVSLMWGTYYNILPAVLDTVFHIDFYPFGIALQGLTFLGMGLLGTGLAFGAVHTLAFVGGYYTSKIAKGKEDY